MYKRVSSHPIEGFTLIELLVVIAIIAILAVVVVLTLNPAELLRQSRDANRLSDMATISEALGVYSEDQASASNFSLGSSSVVYVSIADPSATSTLGDQCQGLGLMTLPSTYTYHCAAPSTSRNINGNGWIPVNLSQISAGSPIGNFPVDPVNVSSSHLYYTYGTSGTQYEVTAVMESQKYGVGGSNDLISGDGGTLASVYEKGTKFGLEPLDYGDATLVGYWNLNEGTGTTAYDYSGNGLTGTWSGNQIGTNGYYTNNAKIGPYAGDFDGSTDKISRAHVSAYDFGTGDFSVVFWIDPGGSWGSGNTLGVIGQKANDTSPGFQIYHDSGDSTQIRLRLGDSSGNATNTISTVGSVPQNRWTFVVAERQSGVGYIYINGVQNASSTGDTKNISGGTANFNIGYADTWGAYYQGLLDDVRIYNHALSAAQITAMYAGGK